MGVVYCARQDHPDRVVALKVIRPGMATTVFRRRFANEIGTLARLRHPGIAQIHDAGTVAAEHGEQLYIAMKYVEGEVLTRYAEARKLGLRARLGLLAKVCDAVEHAHQRGVIHRDLKPPNILVEDGDEGPRPRILDFGVARLTTVDAPVATMSLNGGQLLGTLGYMSPEQVEADPRELDTRSDIYAIGVMGYELLCGWLPIDVSGRTVFAAVRRFGRRLIRLRVSWIGRCWIACRRRWRRCWRRASRRPSCCTRMRRSSRTVRISSRRAVCRAGWRCESGRCRVRPSCTG
jgi:serine/threonine protein kinase